MKICNNPKCSSKGSFLPLNEFNKNKNNKDGLSHRCKKCVKESVKKSYNKNREYYIKDSIKRQKQFKESNPEEYLEYRKKWNNKSKEEGYWKKYYQDNKEKLKEYSTQEYVKEKRNNRWRKRYKEDINFKLQEVMKANFHLFFKDQGKNKNLSFNSIVDYSYEDLKLHLETNFREGMSWDNYGELWEIHHIKPQNLFNPSKVEELKECWKLPNLLPLWKTTQISEQMGDSTKGNRNVKKDEIYKP
jgi:hypothetical protein